MTLSFGESLKKAQTQMKSSATAATVNLSTLSTDDIKPVVLADNSPFVRNNNYVWYNNYTDEKLSYID